MFKHILVPIDLSDKNAKSFRNDIKKYLDAARRASGGSRRGSRTGGGRGPACDYDPKAVREWAAAQGIEVSSRGRVPADLMTRFQEASPR